MNSKYIFLNDKLVPYSEAKLHVSDLSIQRGYGIFDFLKTLNFHPVFIDDYLNRFYHSAEEMQLTPPYGRDELKKHVKFLIEQNGISNSGIKLILTGGFSTDGYNRTEQPNFMMIQTALHPDPSIFEKGLRLITHNYQRQVPSVKTIDYLQSIKLWPQVKTQQADDILYHHHGEVRECPRANIFMIKNKEIFTPKSDILRGITRSKVLSLTLEGYEIKEQDFSLEDLFAADEAFITVTTKNICPLLQLDGKAIGNGTAGVITRQLSDKLLQLIDEDIRSKKGFDF